MFLASAKSPVHILVAPGFSSKGSSGFRLNLLAAPYYHPKGRGSILAAFVTDYSGGTAPDFHRLPY
jgi:hypothetical protein